MLKLGSLRRNGLISGLLAIGCLPGLLSEPAVALRQAGESIEIQMQAVPLNPQQASQQKLGAFSYAGGIMMSSSQSQHLHGLSDLEIQADGQLTAVGDLGHLLEAKLVLDPQGRLAGLTQARLATLTGLDGQALVSKEEADAEGLALMPNGDRLVSFERQHRILRYPAQGGLPVAVAAPDNSFVENTGMEALAADLEAGKNTYLVGAEGSGKTWRCGLQSACEPDYSVPLPADFSLVSIKRLPDGLSVYLLRAWDKERGNRISLLLNRGSKLIGRLDMARPLTIDNFEGVAVVNLPDGGLRFYLLSDDNYNPQQRTLLMAFDWQP